MKLGYGLIGLGGIARTHLQALKCLGVMGIPVPRPDFTALMTTDPGKAELGQDIGFATVTHSLTEFLKTPGLEAVDICTPNSLHLEQILAAAAHKKHIYYEKPLTLNGEEARKLEQELADTDLVIQGAYVLRFLPAVARARALIHQGAIGRIHSFRFVSYHSSYLNPDRPGSWRLRKDMSGGGALMDLGCHLLDLVRFMLGEAADAQAWTKTIVNERQWPGRGRGAVDVDDHALVLLALENGARGSVEVSRVAVGGDGLSLEIYGEQGAIHVNPAQASPRCFNALGEEFTPSIFTDPFLANLNPILPPAKLSMGWMVDAHAAGLAWFLQSIAAGKQIPGTPDLSEGIQTQLLVEKAYKSAEENINN